MNKTKILVIVVSIMAIIGASILVKSNQETRKGASFASVEALFLPSVKTLSVGDKLTTTLMIDAKSHFLTGADIKVKYDPAKLQMDSATVLTWPEDSEQVIISDIDNQAGTFNLVGTNTQKEVTNLPTGVISLVKLNFTAKTSGEARVGLDSSYGNIISGYNTQSSDQELGIEKVSEAKYQIVGEIMKTPTIISEPSIKPTKNLTPGPTYVVRPM